MPTELVADTTRTDTSLTGPEVAELDEAPLVVEEPDGEEVEVAAAFMTSAPHAKLPDSLPETGSILPLMSIAGVVLLGAAILTRRPNSKREE